MPERVHRAERAGFSRLEIADRENKGDWFCYRCQAFHPAAEFGRDNRNLYGVAGSCRRSLAEAKRRGRAVRNRQEGSN